MDSLQIIENVPLSKHSTMRLGGSAAFAVEITSPQQLPAASTWAKSRDLPLLMVGHGSNIVWRDGGFPGLLVINRIGHFEIQPKDENHSLLTSGAGEIWDNVVARSVEAGLSGIEALSLIPGTAGATPVQNVGAYGQDISQTLVNIHAYDTQTEEFVVLDADDCDFSYRSSRFNRGDHGRYMIATISLRLSRSNLQPPFYRALQSYLDEHNITDYTPASIRQAVIAIRSSKLPDPAMVANNGSFFANPIIDQADLERLLADHPDMPHWPTTDPAEAKIPAAWLIEQAGFKDFHDPETGMGTWPAQPLVLVNEHAKSTSDLLAFKQKIIGGVEAKFGITLFQEPELLP